MTAQLKRVLLFVAAGILIAGCGGGSNNPIRTLKPQSVQPSVALTNAIPLLGDLDGDGQPTVGDAIKVLRIVRLLLKAVMWE